MRCVILVLGDPTVLRHMAGAGHYVRFAFRDGTNAVFGPYGFEVARHSAHHHAHLPGLHHEPQVAPTFEHLAEDIEPRPGHRWWWLGARAGGLRALHGPFMSRREARAEAARMLSDLGHVPESWTGTLHYGHDSERYRRTRRCP